jgi:TolB protein
MATATFPAQPGPATLYLVNPAGGRYVLYRWTGNDPGNVVAWSGDKTYALLSTPTGETEQLTLATGQISRVSLPKNVIPVGYTRPSGLNILGQTPSRVLARYSLTGHVIKVLASLGPYGGFLSSPDGATLVIANGAGLKLMSNSGTTLRMLRTPSGNNCSPVRWWNSGTVLATCVAPGSASPRLWLVPINGTRPTAVTPQRSVSTGDLGDLDAWPLPSGLYLQAASACGTLQIFRQSSGGSITKITPPHTTGNNNVIVTTSGSRMLVHAETSCPGSESLLWFDPHTQAEQWLFKTPASQSGVVAVVPFYTTRNAS